MTLSQDSYVLSMRLKYGHLLSTVINLMPLADQDPRELQLETSLNKLYLKISRFHEEEFGFHQATKL
jgi:hypothetical protein